MSSEALPIDKTLYTNRALANLLIPLIIEQMLFLAVGTIDTVMITSLGEEAISGVSLGDMINVVIACGYAALGTGGAVVTSQFLGGKRFDKARESGTHLIYLALLLGIAFMIPMFLLRRVMLRLLFGNLTAGVMENATIYLGITIFTYPLMSGAMACSALFRSMNRSSICMYISLAMNIINLIGNWLFIFVFKLGVAGAAISTLLCRLFSVGIQVWLLTDRKREVWFTFRERFRPRWPVIRGILFIGIPSCVENALFNLGRLLVVAIIAQFGTMQIAANAVANMVCGVTNMVGGACGLAIITVIGQSVGTGSEATVRYYVRKMTIWSQVGYDIWSLMMLPLLPFIIHCFHGLTEETIHLALVLSLIHCTMGTLMWPTAFAFPNVLRAANDVRYTMWVSVLSMAFVRIGLAWVCAKFFHIGAIGVWSAMVCDWVVRIIFFTCRYHSNKWVKLGHLQ